jgi:hypothetical protein
MPSKKQLRSPYDKRAEQKSGLSRHYREIGIKAVAGATRKQQTRDSMAINRKRTAQKEDTMNEDSASRIARESFNKTLETGSKTVEGIQEGFTSTLENVRDLNVRLIAMAQANANAVFDFAREVAEAKAPSDLVQAWTTHATKQFDVFTKQATDLTTLGQQFASTAPETVRRRVV